MKSIVKFLRGRKTYIVGAGTLAWGVYLLANGDVAEGADKALVGLLALVGRAAVAKAEPAVR